MNNTSKDPKRQEFTSKEDLIIFLNMILELSIKHMWRYKEYFKELEKLTFEKISKISNKNVSEITEENYLDIFKNSLRQGNINDSLLKIDYMQYKSIEDKINLVKDQLLNLLGDRTKNGASYLRFRDEYKKLLKKGLGESIPELKELSDEINKILNELYKARNYEHHMTDAKFIEWKNYRLEDRVKLGVEWPTEEIIIDRPAYLSILMLIRLYETSLYMKDASKKVIQQMKKDYSILYGKSVNVRFAYHEHVDLSCMEISERGINRHL